MKMQQHDTTQRFQANPEAEKVHQPQSALPGRRGDVTDEEEEDPVSTSDRHLALISFVRYWHLYTWRRPPPPGRIG